MCQCVRPLAPAVLKNLDQGSLLRIACCGLTTPSVLREGGGFRRRNLNASNDYDLAKARSRAWWLKHTLVSNSAKDSMCT